MITGGARTERRAARERRKRCCKVGVSINPVGGVSSTVPGVTALPADTPKAPGSLLAPEPTVRTGALIGYARVSTSGQLLDRQQHALTEAGCLRIFADKLSGKNADRPELTACLDYLRPGDTLVVPSLDRLSRSLADPDPDRRHAAPARCRLQEPARGPGHHHPRRPARLPCLRRAGGVHPRTDRRGHPRGTGCCPRPRRAPRVAPGHDRRADPPRPRPADPPDNTVSSIARLLGVSRATIYKYVPRSPSGAQPPPCLPGRNSGPGAAASWRCDRGWHSVDRQASYAVTTWLAEVSSSRSCVTALVYPRQIHPT
jgi:hypothetical protein